MTVDQGASKITVYKCVAKLKNSVTFEEWAKNAPQSLLEGVDVEFIKKQIKGA